MNKETNQLLIGIIIGIITGGISSYGVWYYVVHILVPKIKFSDHISKTIGSNGNPVYKIKFENCGKRKAIDLQINTRFRVKGLVTNAPHIWKVAYIPYSHDRREQIPFLSPVEKKQNAMRETIPLLLNEAAFNQNIYPEEIRDAYNNQSLTLENLFAMGTIQKLQVNVFCFDEFSGSRKLFTSKVYSLDDIKSGPFERTSLKIVE